MVLGTVHLSMYMYKGLSSDYEMTNESKSSFDSWFVFLPSTLRPESTSFFYDVVVHSHSHWGSLLSTIGPAATAMAYGYAAAGYCECLVELAFCTYLRLRWHIPYGISYDWYSKQIIVSAVRVKICSASLPSQNYSNKLHPCLPI
jgi:hypothetical protein